MGSNIYTPRGPLPRFWGNRAPKRRWGLSRVKAKGGGGMKLRRFQKEFLAKALAPGIDIAALSLPRGQRQVFSGGHILTRCLTPGDALHQPGKEYVSVAGSIEQARLVYSFIRADLEPTGQFSWIDSVTRLGATHRPSNTKLRIISLAMAKRRWVS